MKSKRYTIQRAMAEAAIAAQHEARKKQAEARTWRRLARNFPRREPEGVKLADSFYSNLTNAYESARFRPRVVFRLAGEYLNKARYREAVRNVMRALHIKHMQKHVWGSDNPEFYFLGLADIGGVEYEIQVRLGYIVPAGCHITRGERRRTWSTVSRGARAYCGVGR